MNRIARILAFAVSMMLAPQIALACSAGSLSAKAGKPINTERPDNATFNQAVLHYLNKERCRAGRSALRSDRGLISMAAGHSTGMAKTGVFGHKIPYSGRETMSKRLKRSKVKWKKAAENIAKNYVYALNGRPIQAKVSSQCSFKYTNGQPVPKHSYASLAKEAVGQWMGSSGHRRNILDRKFNRVGTAFAVDRRGPLCGNVFLTQNFAN